MNLPFTDEILQMLLDKFDTRNPNTGEKLTVKSFYGFYNKNGMDKRLTLISLQGMSDLNGYTPVGTKEKLIKAMKNYDG